MLLQLYNSCATHGLEHWDVSTAFVHAPLKEQVYMKQASGHEERGKEDWVYLLLKALYGCKQSANAWQQHLKNLLKHVGMESLASDPAIYILRRGHAFLIIGTHVDDLFVLSNLEGRPLRDKVWGYLSSKLAIKTLGEAKWTLQMLIQRDAEVGVLKISQENFVVEVLRRFDMTNCKEAPTPAVDSGAEATMSEEDLPSTTAQMEGIKLVACGGWHK